MEAMFTGAATGITTLVAAVAAAFAAVSVAINGFRYFGATSGKQSDDALGWIKKTLVGLGCCLAPAAIVTTVRSWLGQ